MRVLLLTAVIVFLGGCAFLNRVAPSQIDEAGNPIPDTHELIQPVKDVAGSIPYGEAGVGIVLLAWNFYERFRKNQSEKGLRATVLALKQAADDPATKEAFEHIKSYLANAHKVAEIQPLIKSFLSKV